VINLTTSLDDVDCIVVPGIVNAGVDNMRVLIRSKDPIKMTDIKLGMVPIDLADVLHRQVM